VGRNLDGLLFAVVGPQLVCADAATGEVRWRERTGEGTPGVTSVTGPSYADGRLYVRNLREMAGFALTR